MIYYPLYVIEFNFLKFCLEFLDPTMKDILVGSFLYVWKSLFRLHFFIVGKYA